jgi:hypothetical protein
MAVRRKAVLSLAICVLPDYCHCHRVHAQKIRIFLIIDVSGHFVNAASYWTSGASSQPPDASPERFDKHEPSTFLKMPDGPDAIKFDPGLAWLVIAGPLRFSIRTTRGTIVSLRTSARSTPHTAWPSISKRTGVHTRAGRRWQALRTHGGPRSYNVSLFHCCTQEILGWNLSSRCWTE